MLPNGVRLAVVEIGEPENMPVVPLHGFTDSARSWSLMAPFLVDRFRLIIPDLRGHGNSDRPDSCYTIPEMAHDIALLLDMMELERAVCVGHSLGGRIVQAVAQRWPSLVGKAVLVSTSATPRLQSGWLWENICSLQDPIDPNGPFITSWCSATMPVDEVFLDHVRHESASVPARIWHSIYYEQIAYDPGRLLSDIAAETLILHGERDEIATAQQQLEMRDGIGGSRLHTLPDRGHNVHWEVPVEIASLIRQFVA